MLFDPEKPICTPEQNDQYSMDFFWGNGDQVPCQEDLPSNGELVLDSVLGDWIKDTKHGLQELIKDATTSWVSTKSPTLQGADGSPNATIAFLTSSLAWYTTALLALTILFGAGFLALRHRKEDAEKLVHLIVMFIFIAGAGVTLTALFLAMTDGFSVWIIERSLDDSGNFTANLTALFNNDAVVVSSVVMFVLLLIATAVSFIQHIIMICRGAILFVLVGTLPLSAAFYLSDTGKQLLQKQVSWIISFGLYKAVAAIIYATGFRLMGATDVAGSSASNQATYGIALMFLAIFALPATMRLITPAVSQMATGKGAGGAVLGGVAVAGASGARALSRT